MNAVNVPVTITPEARARIDELGMHAEFERMLEYAQRTIPELVKIDVETYWRADDPSPDGVLIRGTTTIDWEQGAEVETALSRWEVRTFRPEVCEHFTTDLLFAESQREGA